MGRWVGLGVLVVVLGACGSAATKTATPTTVSTSVPPPAGTGVAAQNTQTMRDGWPAVDLQVCSFWDDQADSVDDPGTNQERLGAQFASTLFENGWVNKIDIAHRFDPLADINKVTLDLEEGITTPVPALAKELTDGCVPVITAYAG